MSYRLWIVLETGGSKKNFLELAAIQGRRDDCSLAGPGSGCLSILAVQISEEHSASELVERRQDSVIPAYGGCRKDCSDLTAAAAPQEDSELG